jgi:hypothetical protein
MVAAPGDVMTLVSTSRDNRFERIRGPQAKNYSAGPAILAWGGSRDTVESGVPSR